jgi:hypothetical protein
MAQMGAVVVVVVVVVGRHVNSALELLSTAMK